MALESDGAKLAKVTAMEMLLLLLPLSTCNDCSIHLCSVLFLPPLPHLYTSRHLMSLAPLDSYQSTALHEDDDDDGREETNSL